MAQLLVGAYTGGMTLCPVALAIHCVKCPIVKFCPAKETLGDYGTYKGPPENPKAESPKPPSL